MEEWHESVKQAGNEGGMLSQPLEWAQAMAQHHQLRREEDDQPLPLTNNIVERARWD